MDNHQEELAKALKEKHYLEYCLPKVFSTLSRKNAKLKLLLFLGLGGGTILIIGNEIGSISKRESTSN